MDEVHEELVDVECICDFDLGAGCGGEGVFRCDGCGGDQCVCAHCFGNGETECPGCPDCEVYAEDGDA